MARMVNGTQETKVIRITDYPPEFKFVEPGEEIEIPISLGLRCGLKNMETEAIQVKVGAKTAETKKLKIPDENADYQSLLEIKGINKEIADMLIEKYGSREMIIKAGAKRLERLPAIGKRRAGDIMRALS